MLVLGALYLCFPGTSSPTEIFQGKPQADSREMENQRLPLIHTGTWLNWVQVLNSSWAR